MESKFAVGEVGKLEDGLTKREYFAGLAMQAFIPIKMEYAYTSGSEATKLITTKRAVQYADALIAELEKNEKA